MRSYIPNNFDEQNFEEVLKSFFDGDMFLPDSFAIFKKDLFDYFSNINGDEKEKYKNFLLLRSYYAWNNIEKFAPDDVLEYFIDIIPDAFRLGFDGGDRIINYMDLKLRSPKLMTIFYSSLRNEFINSTAKIGYATHEMKISDLIERVRLINSYSENTIKIAEMYDELEKIVFNDFENKKIFEYILVDKRKSVMDLIELVNFLLSVKPDNIWEVVKSIVFSKNTGVLPEEIPVSIIERPVEIEDLPDVKINQMQISNKQELVKKAENTSKNSDNNIKVQPIVLARPSYSEIYQKIDAVFEKDEDGNYEDLDSVMMALEKASKKYNDPKIAELYYFDEESGKFKWNI